MWGQQVCNFQVLLRPYIILFVVKKKRKHHILDSPFLPTEIKQRFTWLFKIGHINFFFGRTALSVRDFCKKICKKKIIERLQKAGVFVSNRSPTRLTYCGNRGKWENQLNIWWLQRWISLKLRYSLDPHLNFIVWKNHCNATARF